MKVVVSHPCRDETAPRMRHSRFGAGIEKANEGWATRRFIVSDVTPGLIAKHTPNVIASDIANPNGKSANAITRNT